MSKRKRIKKLVKGSLTQKKIDGDDLYAAGTARKARSDVLDAMTNANLITALGIANAGTATETINIDGDSDTSFKTDFAPFDAAEQKDTDKDGIGDNKDILLNKIAMDTIFKTRDESNGAVAASGTLQALLIRLEAAKVDLASAAALAVAGDRQARLVLLRAAAVAPISPGDGSIHPAQTSLPGDLTDAALDTLEGLIDAEYAQVGVHTTAIAAMTATAGVTIKTVAAPYKTKVNAPALAVLAAAATVTSVGTATNDVVADVIACQDDLTAIG
jgi:hypothetical protein